MSNTEEGGSRASRRQVVAMMASAAAVGGVSHVKAQAGPQHENRPVRTQPNLALVSRHLQWTNADNGIKIARQAGFPAILWTVRRGAHVEPSQVTTELPRIVAITHDAGMGTPMLITNIGDMSSDGAEVILATMQRLGIPLYRAAAPRYRYDAPIQPQFDAFQRKLAALAKLNEKYGVTAAYHTHAYADTIGGSAWELWMLMKDLDPRYIGLNYDIGHITAKGGAGWRESIRAVGPFLHSCSIKDFYWEKEKNVPTGQWPWRTRLVAPGEGMVNFLDFFRYLQSINFQGPLENYFEYSVNVPGRAQPFDMLGTDFGRWKLEMPEELFVSFLKRDVGFYNNVWQQALTTSPAPPFSVKAGEGPA